MSGDDVIDNQAGTDRLRIALVAHTNAPWTPHYARFLSGRGHRVLVISFHPDRVEGVDSVFVGNQPFDIHAGKHLFVTRAPRVRRLLREFKPDVVFAPYIISNGVCAALAWHGPLVVSGRGSDLLPFDGRYNAPAWLQPHLVRYACRPATAVHVVSDELADAVAAWGIDRGKIRVFPVGVDMARFPRRESGTGGTETPHLICTRKHLPVYRNHEIVAALGLLRDRGYGFRCTMVGGGDLLTERKAQACELGLDEQVRFTDHVPHEKMPGLLRSADIYISASASDGTSSSLLEAMACGLFPVVSDIRANRGWIRDGENGLLFPVGDPEVLAARLMTAIDDPGLRERAAASNRDLVEREGDQATNMNRLESLLDEVAATGGGRSIHTGGG